MECSEEIIDEIRCGCFSNRPSNSDDKRTMFFNDLFRKFSKKSEDNSFHVDM